MTDVKASEFAARDGMWPPVKTATAASGKPFARNLLPLMAVCTGLALSAAWTLLLCYGLYCFLRDALI